MVITDFGSSEYFEIKRDTPKPEPGPHDLLAQDSRNRCQSLRLSDPER